MTQSHFSGHTLGKCLHMSNSGIYSLYDCLWDEKISKKVNTWVGITSVFTGLGSFACKCSCSVSVKNLDSVCHCTLRLLLLV